MFYKGEVLRLQNIAKKLIDLNSLFRNKKEGDFKDLKSIYKFILLLKSKLGNFHNDITFMAGLMAKKYIYEKYGCNFDHSLKADSAAGMDIDLKTKDGKRLIAEIKTTVPCSEKSFGSKQKAELNKDINRLTKESADIKILFLNDLESHKLLLKTCEEKGIDCVLLDEKMMEIFDIDTKCFFD